MSNDNDLEMSYVTYFMDQSSSSDSSDTPLANPLSAIQSITQRGARYYDQDGLRLKTCRMKAMSATARLWYRLKLMILITSPYSVYCSPADTLEGRFFVEVIDDFCTALQRRVKVPVASDSDIDSILTRLGLPPYCLKAEQSDEILKYGLKTLSTVNVGIICALCRKITEKLDAVESERVRISMLDHIIRWIDNNTSFSEVLPKWIHYNNGRDQFFQVDLAPARRIILETVIYNPIYRLPSSDDDEEYSYESFHNMDLDTSSSSLDISAISQSPPPSDSAESDVMSYVTSSASSYDFDTALPGEFTAWGKMRIYTIVCKQCLLLTQVRKKCSCSSRVIHPRLHDPDSSLCSPSESYYISRVEENCDSQILFSVGDDYIYRP